MRWRDPMMSPIVGRSWQVSVPASDCDCAEAGAGMAVARARAKRAIAERDMFHSCSSRDRGSASDVDELDAAVFGRLRIVPVEQLLLAKADRLDALRGDSERIDQGIADGIRPALAEL